MLNNVCFPTSFSNTLLSEVHKILVRRKNAYALSENNINKCTKTKVCIPVTRTQNEITHK